MLEEMKIKLKVHFGGYWKNIKGNNRVKYYLGRQRSLVIEKDKYAFNNLLEDVGMLVKCRNDHRLNVVFMMPKSVPPKFTLVSSDVEMAAMFTTHSALDTVELFVTVDGIDSPTPCMPEINSERVIQDDEDYVEMNEDDGEDEERLDDMDDCISESSYHTLCSSSDEEVEDYEGGEFSTDKENPEIALFTMFEDVKAFRMAIKQHAVMNKFEMIFIKNEKERVTARCADIECPWRIHASLLDDNVTFQIKTLKPEHKCIAVNMVGNKMASQQWVAEEIIEWLRNEPQLTVESIRSRLMQKYSLNIPYQRVWRGKELAYDMIHGNIERSFELAPTLQNELLVRNPGSIVHFKLQEGTNAFQRFFVCLGACRTGFLNGCRPLLGLDGCHIKGRYKGSLMAATALDGNCGLFPVAYAVTEGENYESWMWFVQCLKEAIGDIPHLTIMSDRSKGLEEAVKYLLPTAEHRSCVRHLYKNFKKVESGKTFEKLVWNAARSYVHFQYQNAMDQIQLKSKVAWQYLNDIQTHVWSRWQFSEHVKCHYVTNNLSESFNSFICEERCKPVIDMIDSIRQKLMLKLCQRRTIADRWKGRLVPRVSRIIREHSRKKGSYSIWRASDITSEVSDSSGRWTVNIEQRRCDCRQWQVSGIPCVHGVLALLDIRCNPDDYIDEYFTVEKYKSAYALEIAPMPGKDLWEKINTPVVILPPIQRRPPGRPKKKRIVDPNERSTKSEYICGRCGEKGHNKRRCNKPIRSHYESSNTQESSMNYEEEFNQSMLGSTESVVTDSIADYIGLQGAASYTRGGRGVSLGTRRAGARGVSMGTRGAGARGAASSKGKSKMAQRRGRGAGSSTGGGNV